MLNATPNKLYGSLVALLLAATACTTEVVGNDPDDPSAGGSAGSTTTTSEGGAGGSGGQAVDVTKAIELSDCGGFEPLSGSGDSGEPEAPPAYCDAEVLYWQYDAEPQELTFNDSRVELNCCGDHSLAVQRQADTIIVTETDAPEGGAGRCDCLCVFDFAATAGPVEAQVFQIELVRHVTDSGAPTVVWQGAIDLSEGAGFAIVDSAPSYFCDGYDAPSAS